MFAASAAARKTLLTSGHVAQKAVSSSSSNKLITVSLGSRRSLIVPARRNKRIPSRRIGTSSATTRWAARDRKPTLEIAQAMPHSLQELDNPTLVTLGRLGDHNAAGEMLARHIMTVDKCPYEDAQQKVKEIDEKCSEMQWLEALPYRIGVFAAVTAGFGSFPMVFDLSTALAFNVDWVTTDVPEPQDLETMLEVGSWTWNWMEPPLGQISFFLLCLQYSRAQMHNLGIKPYTSRIKNWRGKRLANQYPDYDARFLINFSETAKLIKK